MCVKFDWCCVGVKKVGGSAPNQTQEWLTRISRWREDYPLVVPHHADNYFTTEAISELSRQST